MRKLSIKDAFTLARIIKKADIKEEIADFANRIANFFVEQRNRTGILFIAGRHQRRHYC